MAPMDAALPPTEFGSAVRHRRLALGLTLDGLAVRSGVSRAMLSDVERAAKNPTIRVACQIAEGLACSVSDLINGQPRELPDDAISIQRARERAVLVDPVSGVERHPLSANPRRIGVELVLYILPPGAETGQFPPHQPGTHEHVTVIRGRLIGRIGATEIELASGDSATYSAAVPHGFGNPTAEPCEFLLVVHGRSSPADIRS